MLSALFKEMFGGSSLCLVATSNRHPSDLYEDGLSRHMYLPQLLEILHANCEVCVIGEGGEGREQPPIDYRKASLAAERTGRVQGDPNVAAEERSLSEEAGQLLFFTAGEMERDATLRQKVLARAASVSPTSPISGGPPALVGEGSSGSAEGINGNANSSLRDHGDLVRIRPTPVSISYGRSLECDVVSLQGNGTAACALFDFRELFQKQHLSADDFNCLCRRFDTVVLQNVPRLSTDEHNEAKRFTNFLDCAYENTSGPAIFDHCRLFLLSVEVEPDRDAGTQSQTTSAASSFDVGAAIFEELAALEQLRMADFGQHEIPAGAADQDTTPGASAIVQAIKKLKEKKTAGESEGDEAVGGSNVDAAKLKTIRHPMSLADFDPKKDQQIWKQDAAGMPQVTKSWDERRRASQFLWEAADPTAEQQTFKGVFAAAIASLHETGFAVKRSVSRLHEMQSGKYLEEWKRRRAVLPAAEQSGEP